MDREISSDPRQNQISRQEVQEAGRSREQNPRNKPTTGRSRPSSQRRDRDVPLSDPERQTLAEIGRFRTLCVEDLARERYGGDTGKVRQDLRHLCSQKLLQTRSVWLAKQRDPLEVVTLTRRGKHALERSGEEGTFYAGFVKPAEMAHDAAIYKMYQAEASRIAEQGGEIRRVTLDYELKRKVYSPLAKTKPGSPDYKRRQAEIAAQHGLKVVRGHVQLPDLRIEYRTSDGEIETRDLELATHHYRPGQLAAKAEAGFNFYANAGDRARLASVFDDHHITSEILRL